MTNIRKLSIYEPEPCETIMTSQQETPHNPIIGDSVMSLVSETKEHYRNLIKSYNNFKTYSISTEGKIKYGVMGTGLLSGFYLRYRSKSKSVLFPVGMLTVTAAACYPHFAYKSATNVVTNTWHGSVSVFNGTKKAYGYIASRLDHKEKPKEEAEKTYVLGESGNLEVIEHPTSKVDDPKEVTKVDDLEKPEVTVLKFLPDNKKVETEDLGKDFGQGKKEDKELYTTR